MRGRCQALCCGNLRLAFTGYGIYVYADNTETRSRTYAVSLQLEQ